MLDLAHAGRVALSAGLMAWEMEIMDPTRKAFSDPAFVPDRTFIDNCIRSDKGLGWARCSALVKEYRWDGDFEWCGAFAAYCWAVAGLRLDIRKRYFPSTYRLDKYGQYKRAFLESVTKPERVEEQRKYLAIDGDAAAIDDFAPRAGDILIVNGKEYGQHITIVSKWRSADLVFDTVEGNATGIGPKGQRFQGVVRQTRALKDCRRLIRPSVCDF